MNQQQLQQLPPAQRAAYMRTLEQLAATPPQVRSMIADEVIQSQKAILPVIYYSEAKFGTTRTGAAPGPYTFACNTTARKAFVYKEGDAMDAAGFVGEVATRAHTNLVSGGGQTNDNSDVIVWGIAVEFVPGGEIKLIEQLMQEVYVELSLNGSQRFLLGKLGDFPSAGGLYGAQHSKTQAGPLPDAEGALLSYVANGNPMAGNFWKLPYPFRWNAIGSGKKDTSLAITLTPANAIEWTSSADRAAAAGTDAFNVPAADDVFQIVRVKLATVQIGERSLNA